MPHDCACEQYADDENTVCLHIVVPISKGLVKDQEALLKAASEAASIAVFQHA